jgi:uncharacterized delta-60 repeat protein
MKKLIFIYILLVFNICHPQVVSIPFNQNGFLTNFNPTFLNNNNMSYTDTSYSKIEYLSNGKVALYINAIPFGSKVLVCNSNGTLWNNFSPYTGFSSEVLKIKEVKINNQSKLLIADRNKIIRLNLNGTLDTTFNVNVESNPNSQYEYKISDFAVQNDGKILIVGNIYKVNGENKNTIFRLNPDGSLDNSFQNTPGILSDGYKVHIQNDGKILVIAKVINDNSHRVIRINSNGIYDLTFLNPNTDIRFAGSYQQQYNIKTQSDGKILISAAHGIYNYKLTSQNKFLNGIARLNSNGTLDTSFGRIIDSGIWNFEVDNKDNIYLSGELDVFVNAPNGTDIRKTIVKLDKNSTSTIPFLNQNPVPDLRIYCMKMSYDKTKIMVISGLNYTQITNQINRKNFLEFHINEPIQINPNDLRGRIGGG